MSRSPRRRVQYCSRTSRVISSGVRERPTADEAALGASGHDDRVLDDLRERQVHHLGAEVVRTIGVADPAARHRGAAQMDPLHPRRAHPHFAEEATPRHAPQQLGGELEREVGAPRLSARWGSSLRSGSSWCAPCSRGRPGVRGAPGRRRASSPPPAPPRFYPLSTWPGRRARTPGGRHPGRSGPRRARRGALRSGGARPERPGARRGSGRRRSGRRSGRMRGAPRPRATAFPRYGPDG